MSDAVASGERPLVLYGAGVERHGWLEQQDVGFRLGERTVFDAFSTRLAELAVELRQPPTASDRRKRKPTKD